MSPDVKQDHNLKLNKTWMGMIWTGLLRLQRTILILTSILIVLGISITAIFRYVFKVDIFGMEEIIVIFAFWLYFTGGAYGSYERSHISADIISSYVKNERTKSMIKAATSLITTVLCLIFAWWAVQFFIWSFESGGKSPTLGIPSVVPKSAICFGFILMAFYSIVHLINDIRACFDK
ncbi:TRAP transporter small permease [Neobacillus niacini]|uniref:TRAP transporter small permease n=1 Tax=Neobacillus niacini TaxID=86668 RepID=UPI0021CAF586|nr:TRAP transporter small permease [Neobacillus niacini]MCM3766273.1 TRAP transporter small permease [Neobacillus niacini]